MPELDGCQEVDYQGSGSLLLVPGPLAAVAFCSIGSAITHLREVLGDESYESFARTGATMTTAAIVAYAFDQIDQRRTELLAAQR
jgi:hypothetical protein